MRNLDPKSSTFFISSLGALSVLLQAPPPLRLILNGVVDFKCILLFFSYKVEFYGEDKLIILLLFILSNY